jgi:hypothetical protein
MISIITSVCEIIITNSEHKETWTPEDWAENIKDCILDAIGFPDNITIKVKTLSLTITEEADKLND